MDFSTILQTPTFRAIVQENALDRMFRDALFPKLLFRMAASAERWDGNIGDNKTFTGMGLIPVKVRPIIPGSDPTPATYPIEQWNVLQAQYTSSIDTNLPTSLAACVQKLTKDMQQLGLNAGQTLNRAARNVMFNAAESGWTVADGAQTTVTTLRVKRLNGFVRARRPDLPAGSPVRYDFVTGNNPLPITVIRTVGGAVTVNVTGFTPDTPGDEIGPGVLTIDAAVTVADRDPVFASTRTFRVISGGGNAVDAVGTTDILHLSDIRTLISRMRNTNVQDMPDGSYHLHLDPISEGQIFADTEFQQLMRGTAATLPDGMAYRDFVISRLMGGTWFRNNENPQALTVAGGSTATFSQDDAIATELFSNGTTTGVPVHRVLVIGAEALMEYYCDQRALETEAGVQGRIEYGARIVNNGVDIDVEQIRVIMRSPQDRLQQNVSNTWSYIGNWVARTDGATGDAATYKRLGTILHGE